MNMMYSDFNVENLQSLSESRTSGLATLFSADSRPLGMRPCSWAGLIMGISVDRGGEMKGEENVSGEMFKSPQNSQALCLANHPRSPCAARNIPPPLQARQRSRAACAYQVRGMATRRRRRWAAASRGCRARAGPPAPARRGRRGRAGWNGRRPPAAGPPCWAPDWTSTEAGPSDPRSDPGGAAAGSRGAAARAEWSDPTLAAPPTPRARGVPAMGQFLLSAHSC